ncbi:MAG: N-acetyltransferase [Anaerolineae bacterium]|nr:N-acetyltransferase [Anaerolineae bacterium]
MGVTFYQNQSSNFDVQVAAGTAEVDPAAWDRLAGERPFASYRWYRFAETVLGGGKPLYITLSQAGEPVARATFWLEMQEPLAIAPGPLQGLIDAALHRWPVMTCCSPLFPTSGLILPDPPRRSAALRALLQATEEQARQHRASFILFDHLEPEQIAGWPAPFTPAAFADPGTYLAITWPDFDSYVQQLSKSARKDYRRHRNRAADLGIEVTAHDAITTPPAQALALIENVEANHGSVTNPWTCAVLEHAGMIDTVWLTATIGSKLVGCGLLVGDGDGLFLALLGLDYDVQYVYFQLVYASIRSAIERGYQVVRGGREAYETKERLGFRLETNHHVMFAGRTRLLQGLGRWLAAGEAVVG